MPCSCRKSKQTESSINVLYREPSNVLKTNFNIVTAGAPYKPVNEVLQVSDSKDLSLQDLDFGSTTKPTQLCFNCVRKHLGLAYIFFQQDSLQDNLAGLGQLCCASDHLARDFKSLSQQIYGLAADTLQKLDFKAVLPHIEQLLQTLTVDPTLAQNPQEKRVKNMHIEFLLSLAKVYSLLFIEISYEEINKSWAVSQLAFRGIRAAGFQGNRDLYMQLRELWKIIQSMQVGDELYLQARKRLMQFMIDAYNKYKQKKEK